MAREPAHLFHRDSKNIHFGILPTFWVLFFFLGLVSGFAFLSVRRKISNKYHIRHTSVVC